jgi:arylsulfatase A-like enzyme
LYRDGFHTFRAGNAGLGVGAGFGHGRAMRVPVLIFLLVVSIVRAAERPNIIFIMTDDHASHALSCYGSKVNVTPHLDRIAKDGVRFANAFVTNSICTPSRATILTGKYSHMNGTPVFNRFDGSQQTVAKLLQAGGYHTGMIGKWHLGSDPTGFDRWIVLPGQGNYNDPDFLTAEGRVTVKGYTTDVITDLGVEWLETRPKEKPFFLMLHHKAPHRVWEPDEKNRALFAKKTIPEPATLFDDYKTRPAALPENAQTIAKDLTRRDLKLAPPSELTQPERNKWLNMRPTEVEITTEDGGKKTLTGEALVCWMYQRYMQDYLACVQGVDDNIGRLLGHLEKTGLAKNTVIFYTADNGFFLGDNGMYDKRFMYEPSLRVPLLVRGPGVKAGAVSEMFALNNDFAPTFLDFAGQPVPADMQGRSLLPLLRGETPADWRGSMYYRYYHDPGHHDTRAHYGVRTATHKLIYYWRKDAWEMFDLRSDQTEQRNIAGDEKEAGRLAEMKAELARLRKELRDDDQFADALPKDGVDGQFKEKKPLGVKTAAEAVAGSASK